MFVICLRERRQVTLPAEVVAAAGLQTSDELEVSVVNGVIHMVPAAAASTKRQPSMRRFLGATAGLYGHTAEQADDYVRQQRDSW